MKIINGRQYFIGRELRDMGIICLGDQSLRQYVQRGKIGCTKVGNRFYFTKEDVSPIVKTLRPHAPTHTNAIQ